MDSGLKKSMRSPGGERGSVILMALFLVFFISALMITVELLRLSDLETITNQVEDMQAYYCAEAGIEYAIWLSRYSQQGPAAAWWPSTGAAVVNQTLGPFSCTDNGTVTTGWRFTISVSNKKADPAIGYYHYFSVTSTGTTGVAGAAGVFTRRVRADIRRPILPTLYETYQQIRRWREL